MRILIVAMLALAAGTAGVVAQDAPPPAAKPTLQQPVKPMKPDIVVKAEEAAAAAEAAAPADAPADGTTTPMDPAVAEAKAAYDAAFAQYEEQSKAYSSEWKKYLVSVVTANMQGVKSNRPYMYFVPGGNDDGAQLDRQNQLDNVGNVVARGVLPGNMMAFGGPDSTITAQLVVDAFKEVQAGSFKDVSCCSSAPPRTSKASSRPSRPRARTRASSRRSRAGNRSREWGMGNREWGMGTAGSALA